MNNKISNKRKVAFPRMGNIHIPMCAMLREMGADIVLPPKNNKKALSLGTRYSPETICLPYKLNLGNYIQALEAGANTLLMFQAPGSCRLGNYATMSEEKLRELGYKFDMIIFNIYDGSFIELVDKFNLAAGTTSFIKGLKGLQNSLAKFDALDTIETELFYIRPREVYSGEAEKIYLKGRMLIDKAQNSDEVKKITNLIMSEYKKINIKKSNDIIKIFLTGEFFVLLDPFVNMNIEKELGRLGVEVSRQVMLSDWTNQALKPRWLRKESHKERGTRTAKKYMTRIVGGDCTQSIGDAVYAAENNIDGVIHIGPFNCTPEIISQSILPHVSREENIPVISLFMDEHTGKAGFVTRLEAFVDLVKRRTYKENIKHHELAVAL